MTPGRPFFSSIQLLVAIVRRVLADHNLDECQRTTGIHRNSVASWEKGLYVPRRSSLARFLKSYGISPSLVDPLLDLMAQLSALLGGRASKISATTLNSEQLIEDLRPLLNPPLAGTPAPQVEASSPDDQVARLLEFDHVDRLALVNAATEFQSFRLAERLCVASIRAAAKNAQSAAELARLSVEVADLIGHDALRGYALGHLGNAYRVGGRLHQADRSFVEAFRLWRSAPDHAGLDPGRLPSLLASLRRAQRRLPEALDILLQAEPFSREPGRLLLKLSTVHEHMGNYQDALRALDRAAPHLDPADRRDQFLLRLGRGIVLCHMEGHSEALTLAEDAIGLAALLSNPLDFLRAVWLRGRVAAGLREYELAEDLLQTVRDEFDGHRLHYDVALVSLELAGVVLEAGGSTDLQNLASSLSRFNQLGVSQEARKALKLFSDAVRREAASAQLARNVLAFLYRARYDDSVRFAA